MLLACSAFLRTLPTFGLVGIPSCLMAFSLKATFWCFWHKYVLFLPKRTNAICFGLARLKKERDIFASGFSSQNFACRFRRWSFEVYFCIVFILSFSASFLPGRRVDLSDLFMNCFKCNRLSRACNCYVVFYPAQPFL